MQLNCKYVQHHFFPLPQGQGSFLPTSLITDRLLLYSPEYEHDKRWGDGNGFSHVRAAFMRPSLSVPVINGKVSLGTWQQIVFIDFDNRGRNRTIIVQVMGVS
jgi:secondary thiamine-phosphate synthase enzyme